MGRSRQRTRVVRSNLERTIRLAKAGNKFAKIAMMNPDLEHYRRMREDVAYRTAVKRSAVEEVAASCARAGSFYQAPEWFLAGEPAPFDAYDEAVYRVEE